MQTQPSPTPDRPDGTRLNLGCGPKRKPGFLGVDIGDHVAVDVRMDAMAYLQSLPANSVQDIYTRHFLEHVEGRDLHPMLLEMNRVLRIGGRVEIIVPHHSNPYYYSDPTHRTFFGAHTMSYFCDRSCLHRRVPRYAEIVGWSLTEVTLTFKPYKKLKLLGITIPLLSAWLNWGVNKSVRAIEVFEYYLCKLFPVYEITYVIEKRAH